MGLSRSPHRVEGLYFMTTSLASWIRNQTSQGLCHLQVLKEGRKNKQSDLSTPMKVRAAARAMASDTMAAQVNDEDTMIAKTWQL